MPNSLSALDNGFPDFSHDESTEEKLDVVMNYLYQMMEQLRYTLSNIGEDNFNETELSNLGERITGPLSVCVEDATGKVSLLEHNINGLHITVDGNTTEISGVGIKSSRIEGTTLLCVLKEGESESTGNMQFWYEKTNKQRSLAGELRMDIDGAGTLSQSQKRIFFSAYDDFTLKLESNGNTSYSSKNGVVYIRAGGDISLNAGGVLAVNMPSGKQYRFQEAGIYCDNKLICSAS